MDRSRVVRFTGIAVVVVAILLVVFAPPFARRSPEMAQVAVAPDAQFRAMAPAEAAAPSVASVRVQTAEGLAFPSPQELYAATVPAADSARLLIRTGSTTIQVDSLEPAAAAVRRIAAAVGGYVATTSMRTVDRLRSGELQLKVPAVHFDEAMERLRAIGKVELAEAAAEDVGEEYVDIAARLGNARRLETRLLELLASRTGRLSDVLEVERELARIRQEIERYTGRLQFLRQHAAVSTITVQLHEPGTVIGREPGASVIGAAFLQAWRNFIGLLALLVQSLGIVLPLGALAYVAWLLWRRYGGKRA